MKDEQIDILKLFAMGENVSVEYYNGGKSYTIPVPAFLWNPAYSTLDEEDDDVMNMYIDCSYSIVLGRPFLHCEIKDEYSILPLEKISIPLQTKKLTKHQRAIMSLINACSKRVIALEIGRAKYAMTTALGSLNTNKEYT